MPDPEKEPTPAEDWGASEADGDRAGQGPQLMTLVPDTAPYRVAVWAMAATIVLSIIGALALAAFGKEAPEMVVAIASACVGAIGGMLAPSRNR